MFKSETPPEGPLQVIMEKSMMPLGDTSREKRITRIFPRVLGPAGTLLKWRVGISSDPAQSPAWGPEVPFVIGTDYKVDCRLTGRYISVRVESVTERLWRIAGFDIEAQDAGGR
jgi:hypothetical protein